jgi:hypothetical protein
MVRADGRPRDRKCTGFHDTFHGYYMPSDDVLCEEKTLDHHLVYLYRKRPTNLYRERILIGEVRRASPMIANKLSLWRAFPARETEFPEVFPKRVLALEYLLNRWELGDLSLEDSVCKKPERNARKPRGDYVPDAGRDGESWVKFFGENPFDELGQVSPIALFMRKRTTISGALLGSLVMVLAFLSTASQARAASHPLPSLNGYTKTYSHNFASQGLGDWCHNCGNYSDDGTSASSSVSTSNGLGITVTGSKQAALYVGPSTVVKPESSFVQARVYLPALGNGQLPNWPAFWMANYGASPQTTEGEIDMVEGLNGLACWHTYYNYPPANPGGCANSGAVTGWVTLSMLWTGTNVEFWYGSTYEGTVQLTSKATTPPQLLFDDVSSGDNIFGCQSCFGPASYPSTTWLKAVVVYAK